MRKGLAALALAGLSGLGVSFAGQQEQTPWWLPKSWTFNFFGLSYHLQEGVKDAPRKLDSNGRWVFNPGVGIIANWKRIEESGFTPSLGVGWFQDCGDKALYHIVGGLRYRYVTDGGWTFGFFLGGGAFYGEDWDTGEYQWTGLPFGFVSLGHLIDLGGRKVLPEINVTYVPENDVISATQDTDIIFTFLSLSF